MDGTPPVLNRRLLVIDDQELIHVTFDAILGPATAGNARSATAAAKRQTGGYEIEHAYNGADGVARVRAARDEGRPFAVAFVDNRMEWGWDGVETIGRLWEACPQLQVVLCSACLEYSWADIVKRLGQTDRLLILKKPFEKAEVLQMACALTEKWRLAQQVQLNLDELEQRVRDRTQEIGQAHADLLAANQALAAARDAAEAANRAKSDFLANMSHEIRTPMAAIIGYTDLILDAQQSPVYRLECTHTVRRNAEHLLAVINDILDISKIEAGKLGVERLACSPRQLLRDVSDLMRVRADEKGLAFVVDLEGAVPETIWSDPTRLRQILVNLLSNAIKFTRQGTVRLVARQDEGEDAAGPRIAFEVHDTGIGLTGAQITRLFEPFTQADTSTSRQFGGTGLGLAISRRLAGMLGGELGVTSVPGQGSTFRLLLPAGRWSDADPDTDRHPISVPDETPPPVARPLPSCARRVLLAEDAPDLQRLGAYLLEKLGCAVEVAPNGRVALDRALAAWRDGQAFDVIFMDMQMPVMDGYTATRQLRQEGYAGTIVALTAHAMIGDRDQCLAAGCDDYTTKPINVQRLAELVAHDAAGNPVS